MKHFLLFCGFCLAFLFPAIPAFPQSAPAFTWAKSAGNQRYDVGRAIAADASGNTFVVGHFENSITFGTTTLLSSGLSDIFVVKYDPSGNVVWAKRGGGSNNDYGYGIGVDGAGNCYITGTIYSAATFGSFTLTPSGPNDIVFAKYDVAGNVVWAKRAGGTGGEIGFAIAVDGTGNSYITGGFGGLTVLGNNVFNNPKTYSDLFIIKVDQIGDIIWAKQGGGTQAESVSGYAITLDGNNNVLVTGRFINTANFSGITLTSTVNSLDSFILKYDSSGNIIWAKKATTNGEGFGIAADAAGNSYVTGYFVGQSALGSITLTGAGSGDIFVAKYDPLGNIVWANNAGGTGSDRAHAIAVDNAGNCYISGYFIGSANFGSTTIKGDRFDDAFIAKYDPAGSLVWAKQAGGFEYNDSSYGVAVDGNGNSFSTGSYYIAANFDGIKLTAASSTFSNTDMFVAKLGNTPIPCTNPSVTISSVCSGSSQNVTFNLTGQPPYRIFYYQNSAEQVIHANSSPYILSVPNSTFTEMFTLIGVSSGNCYAPATGSVVLTPLPSPQFSSSNGCPGPRTLTVTGAPAGSTYNWYAFASSTTPIAGVNSGTYTTPNLFNTTNYYVSIVDAGGCESSRTTVTATVNPVPSVTMPPSRTVCASGNPINLIGANPSGGTWSGPGVTPTGVFTPSHSLTGPQTLTYTVSPNGCPGTGTTTITVNPGPATPTISFIAPDTLMASISGNSYEWKLNGTTLPNITQKLKVTSSGNYTVRVIGTGNCASVFSPAYNHIVSGLKEQFNASLALYPNPTSGILNLELPSQLTVEVVVFNSLGQVVLSKTVAKVIQKETITLNLTGVAKGMYFIQVRAANLELGRRVLVN